MSVPLSPHWSPLKDRSGGSNDGGSIDDKRTVDVDAEAKSSDQEIKSHRCPCCMEVMVMPKRAPNILMPCGHTFCNQCLNTRDDPKCRTCGERWRHRVPNHKLQTSIQTYVDATEMTLKGFEDSVLWKDSNHHHQNTHGAAASSYEAALARVHVRCEQLRERMVESEKDAEAALERENVAAKNLEVRVCDEDNVRVRLAEVKRELDDARRAVEAQRDVVNAIRGEVREHRSRGRLANETLSGLEAERGRLSAMAEGSKDGRPKPKMFSGMHIAHTSSIGIS